MQHGDASISQLVAAAESGDEAAWREIVDRYTPLLTGVLRRYRLSTAAREDVAQTVWLRLVEHLGDLREPRALPMWISTTAKRECLRVLTVERGTATPVSPLDEGWQARGDQSAQPDEELLRAERRQALLEGLAELPRRHRELLLLLVADPPIKYTEIARRIGMPVGSIGPTRARALERLHSSVAVQEFLDETPGKPEAGGDRSGSVPLG